MSNIKHSLGVSGHYKLVLRKADGTIKQELEFDNLITDYGLHALISVGMLFNIYSAFIALGTGSSEPSFSDLKLHTQLGNRFGSSGNETISNRNTVPYYTELKRKFPSSPGDNTGVISEIGLFISSTGDTCFSRSLIKDSNGNPTTITKLADEFLDVYYSVRLMIPMTDTPFSINISGVNYTGYIRPVNVFGGFQYWSSFWGFPSSFSSNVIVPYNGTLPLIHRECYSTSNSITDRSSSFTSNSTVRKRTFTIWWNPDKGNLTINSVLITSFPSYLFVFNTPIVKTANQKLTLSFEFIIDRV